MLVPFSSKRATTLSSIQCSCPHEGDFDWCWYNMNNMVHSQHWLAQHMHNILQRYQSMIRVDFSHFLLHMLFPVTFGQLSVGTSTRLFHSQHFHAYMYFHEGVVFFIEHIAASYSVSPFTHEPMQGTGLCQGYHRSCPKPRPRESRRDSCTLQLKLQTSCNVGDPSGHRLPGLRVKLCALTNISFSENI